MKKLILIIALIILAKSYNLYCQINPQVSVIGNPIKEFEYKCYTNEQTYSIEFPYYIITYLDYTHYYNYDLTIYEPTAFDQVTYHTSPAFTPSGSYYQWNHQYPPTAYVDITFHGSYSNLDLYSSEYLRFHITEAPYILYDTASTGTHVVTPMYISGPYLVCSNPVSFYLNEMPTYSSATWEIKQGAITRSSGSDTIASASNLSNGNAEVIFTVHFECGLKNLVFNKEFHFGPYNSSDYPISGPSSAPCYSYVYFSIPQLAGVTSINWTWPGEWTYVSGQGTRYLALKTGQYSGMVGVGVNNICGPCGSYHTEYVYVYGYCGYGFTIYPNPAADNATITINEDAYIIGSDSDIEKVDISNLLPNDLTTYTIRIYNSLGTLLSTTKRSGTSFNIPLTNMRDGTYIVEVSDGKNSYREQLIIKHD